MTLVRTMMTVLNNGDDNWCCQDVDAVGKTVDSDGDDILFLRCLYLKSIWHTFFITIALQLT